MNNLRITSGEYKGRKITTPGGHTHPMGERERLALFNVIVDYIPDAKVLDAFAGSGALGIEALSRGALSVVFMEKDVNACQIIKQNLTELSIDPARASVLRNDVYQTIADTPDQWEVVIADPPYDMYDERKIQILARVVATPRGILVLSHPGEAPELPGLKLIKTRTYAAAHLSVYAK